MKIVLGQKIGLEECPYMERWVMDFGPFAIRLHHWLASDDIRAPHDHAWWFLTLVLWGGYTDVSPDGEDHLKVGSIRFRKAEHKHTVKIDRETWTIMITGRESRKWGFWFRDKMIKRDKYFAEHGHHPCDQITETPIRIRPDGSRI